MVSRGANFGWPCFEGNLPNLTYQSAPECLALPQGSVKFPFVTYDHSVGSAVIGGPIYTASLYPQQYQGSFFYGDYTGNFIRRVVFDAQRNPVSSVTFATDVAVAGLARGRARRDDLLQLVHDRPDPADSLQRPGRGRLRDSDVRLFAVDRDVLERRIVEPGRRRTDLSLGLRRRHDVDRGEPDPHVHERRAWCHSWRVSP